MDTENLRRPIFTIDWENWNRGLFVSGKNRIEEPTLFLLDLLDKYGVKAIFYCLWMDVHQNWDLFKEIEVKHVIGCHGYYHYHNESRYLSEEYRFRSPFWDETDMPFPPSGGFFFRVLPVSYLKFAINKSGVFWIHPHDIDLGHPHVKNPILNFKRHIGLKGSRHKLERVIDGIEWGTPSSE